MTIIERILEFLRQARRNRRWRRAVTCLAALFVFGTTYALVLPAITLEHQHPSLGAELLEAEAGDVLSVRVRAEAPEGGGERTVVLTAQGREAGLSASYAFDAEGIARVVDEAGAEILLHRTVREGAVDTVDYWFTLAAGQRTSFLLELEDEISIQDVIAASGIIENIRGADATASSSNAARTEREAAQEETEPASGSNAARSAAEQSAKASSADAAAAEKRSELGDGAVLNDIAAEEQGADITATLLLSAGSGNDVSEAIRDTERNADKRGDAQLRFNWRSALGTDGELSWSGDGVQVKLYYSADAGIPEDAGLSVREIAEDSEEYRSYYADAERAVSTDGQPLASARFFDITILAADGSELQPKSQVMVKINYEDSVALPEDSEVHAVHFAEEGAELLDAVTGGSEGSLRDIAFSADHFSVYAVVATGSGGTEARMTLNFYNGTRLIASMYVKNGDTPAELEKILYDPGVGAEGLKSGQVFKGWTFKKDYDVSDIGTDALKTIEDLREWAAQQTITEGAVKNIYAAVFWQYVITYRDDKNVVTHTDSRLTREKGEWVDYQISQDFTPTDVNSKFLGWNSGNSEHIRKSETEPAAPPYAFGEALQINDSVSLTVNAVPGHWLVFEENGSGVSYTPPQFIEDGHITEEPGKTPERVGYAFGGWYETADGSGAAFVFGSPLDENKTLYAKWEVVPTADYTVIIWKQSVEGGDKYDFEKAVTLQGNANQPIPAGAIWREGDTLHVGGAAYQYEGFSLQAYDASQTVAPEGTTVVNIYFDRIQYTLTFQAEKEDGSWWGSYTWDTIKTITALYGQNISSHFPIQGTDGVDYTGYVWNPQGSAIYTTGQVPSLDVMPAENTVFHAMSYGGNILYTLKYYVEIKAGETAETTYDGKKFKTYKTTTIRAGKDLQSTKTEDFVDLKGFTQYASVPEYESDGKVNLYYVSGRTIKFYYTRKQYPIAYADGKCVDGDGNEIQEEPLYGSLKTSELIDYEADVSAYGEGGDKYYIPDRHPGFTFAGWYLDSACTRKYAFISMPEGGITVYAKWIRTQYRVFLHPNVPNTDASFEWGNQQANFRVDHGKKVAAVSAVREDYELIGWYLDDKFTRPYNFDAYVLNDITVPEDPPYDKEKDFTDPMDKYGGGATYNKDVDRFWIIRKLDLYAKWRSKLQGADGIQIKYVDLDNPNNPTLPEDDKHYPDEAQATAAPASTPAPAPSQPERRFLYWVLQHWDGDKYTDTEIHVYPGDEYIVKKADAKHTVLPAPDEFGNTHEYVVQLRAEYAENQQDEVEIRWFGNGGAAGDGKTLLTDEKLQVNQGVDIKSAATFSREGYRFLGWARVKRPADGSEPQEQALTERNLYLRWIETEGGGEYHLEDSGSPYHNYAVAQVAADKKEDLHDMYAVWKRVYTLTVIKKVDSPFDTDKGDKEYSFTLSGLDPDGAVKAFSLKHEGSKEYPGIPEGTSLSLAETGLDTDMEASLGGTYTDAQGGTQTIKNLSFGTAFEMKGDTTITVTNKRRTIALTLKKVGRETQSALPGAEFRLAFRNAEGVYAEHDGIPATKAPLNLGESGSVQLTGLPSGDYKLTETKAPDGYIVMTKDIYFTVNAGGSPAVAETDGHSEWTELGVQFTTDHEGSTLTVPNTAGTALPNTGGHGTLPYRLAGLALMLMGAAYVLCGFGLRRRKERRYRS